MRETPRQRVVEPKNGISYGLDYAWMYRAERTHFVVYRRADGEVAKRFYARLGGRRSSDAGSLLRAEGRAREFCQALNGITGPDLAGIDGTP